MARTMKPGGPLKDKKFTSGARPEGKKQKAEKSDKSHGKKPSALVKSPGAIAADILKPLSAEKKKNSVSAVEKLEKRKGREEIGDDFNEALPKPKKVKFATKPSGHAAVLPNTTLPSNTGMSPRDASRLKGNLEIMDEADRAEYQALYMEMVEAKVLIGNLTNEQAVRNKKLEELAKKAWAKVNTGKAAWSRKA